MYRIAIIEDLELMGSGIKSILSKETNFDLIVQARSIDELLLKLGNEQPQIIIFDIIHGENSGIKVLKKIRRNFARVPALLIVNQYYSDCFEEYIRLGAKGFIFDRSDGDELLRAIKKLKNGEEYFTQEVWNIFKASIRARKYKSNKEHDLTNREAAVLKLFSKGMSYKEIGTTLNISPRTVESHKRNILSKLKINTTADMIRYAYRKQILS